MVLDVLKINSLWVISKKCNFGKVELEHLGHIIHGEGVAADPYKVEAMKQRPLPKS